MRELPVLLLVLPGDPPSKGRPRFGRGRTYTPKATEIAERDIWAAWHAAGRLRFDPALPLGMVVAARFVRPQTHWSASGELSLRGTANAYPMKRPDADNIVKIVMDALNGHAYGDDAQVVSLTVTKTWCQDLEQGAQTVVTIHPLTKS